MQQNSRTRQCLPKSQADKYQSITAVFWLLHWKTWLMIFRLLSLLLLPNLTISEIKSQQAMQENVVRDLATMAVERLFYLHRPLLPKTINGLCRHFKLQTSGEW